MPQALGYISLLVRDYSALTKQGVKFVHEPKEEDYGTVAVFEDLYGNKWDLLQRKQIRRRLKSKA